MIKKSFFAGLVILLPVALTVAIVLFIFNFLTEPFIGVVEGILQHYGAVNGARSFWTSPQFIRIIAKILVLLFLFALTVGLGILARWFLLHKILEVSEKLVHRIPLINTIYRTSKDVIHTIFQSDTGAFKQVVLVPFPHTHTYSVGLVTREVVDNLFPDQKQSFVAVFVPTTPNPTSGFLIMYPPQDLIYLDMKIEEAFKYIISCGVITPQEFLRSKP